jgi:hypothetical protein
VTVSIVCRADATTAQPAAAGSGVDSSACTGGSVAAGAKAPRPGAQQDPFMFSSIAPPPPSCRADEMGAVRQPELTTRHPSTTVDTMDVGQLHTLAGDAGSQDPLVALRAVAQMRRELDRHEATAVRRARNANASWQLIALCLGVSKQAVHKKYGRA